MRTKTNVRFFPLLATSAFLMGAISLLSQTADAPTPGTEYAASINLRDKDVKVEGRLFVPKTTGRIRSVLTVVQYGHSDLIYDSELWRRALEGVQSATLHARVSHITTPSNDDLIYRDASRGGADGVEAVLARLAIDSGHAELNDAPLAFWGWSAAAGFGASFGAQHPDRTLAFIRYHIHQRTTPVNVNATKGIPALLMAGGKDTTAGVDDARTLWISGRSVGAPWTFIIEPNVPHGMINGNIGVEFITNSNQLMIPWLTAIIRQRLPQMGRMRQIDDSAGWIGNNRTGEISSSPDHRDPASDVTWLPDESSARGWQVIRLSDHPETPLP